MLLLLLLVSLLQPPMVAVVMVLKHRLPFHFILPAVVVVAAASAAAAAAADDDDDDDDDKLQTYFDLKIIIHHIEYLFKLISLEFLHNKENRSNKGQFLCGASMPIMHEFGNSWKRFKVSDILEIKHQNV